MEEKKKQAVESGSLYMTLDAFYRPVYLSMRGQGKRDFPVISVTTCGLIRPVGEFIPDH